MDKRQLLFDRLSELPSSKREDLVTAMTGLDPLEIVVSGMTKIEVERCLDNLGVSHINITAYETAIEALRNAIVPIIEESEDGLEELLHCGDLTAVEANIAAAQVLLTELRNILDQEVGLQ